MKRKSIVALMMIIGLSLTLMSSACSKRHSGGGPPVRQGEAPNIAPSDAQTGAQKSNQAAAQVQTNSIVDPGGQDVDFAEREEIRRSYTLKPGARVEINNINGRVDVETADTDMAEVLIVRSAKKRDDLQFRRINIEHESDQLVIRVENDRRSLFSALGSLPEGRQRVLLKLPRKVELRTHGLNGNVNVGEIDGTVGLNGVNGEIKLARATGGVEVRGLNGNVEATIAKLARDGVQISGVNGNIELRFVDEVNAEIEMRGINGQITPELPGFVAQGEQRRGRLEGRVGTGGPHIEVHGVNGNVSLLHTGKANSATAKTSAK